MKNNPKYVRFPQKSYPLRPILHEFDTYSRYARTVLNCEKKPFLHEYLDEPDTPLTLEWHRDAVAFCTRVSMKVNIVSSKVCLPVRDSRL